LRQISKIRTVCANERPHGSVRGVSGNRHPYRDLLRASARSPGRDRLSRRSATNRAFTALFSM